MSCSDCGHRYSESVLASHRLSHSYYEEPDADLAARAVAGKRQRFAQLREELPDVFERPGHVLDIGCNAGELLSLFQGAGWRVAGVEMSPGPAGYAAKTLDAPIWSGTVEAYEPQGDAFDLITMMHVLEHLHAPADTLRRLMEWLCPGGGVLVEVPNAEDLLLPVFRGFYRPLCPGDHVSFFDASSLSRLLESCGLRVNKIFSPLHARDVVYGSALSLVDVVRTRGGLRLAGAGGVESQVRYRGRFRRPLKRMLDVVVESLDSAVRSSQARIAPERGSAVIAYATKA